MTEQEKITLEHIAPYLPYGLKYATLSDDDDKYYIKPNYNTIGFGVHQSNVQFICIKTGHFNTLKQNYDT